MMRRLPLGALSAALLLLSACGSAPIKIIPGEPVTITHTEHVPLPAALTAACAPPAPDGATNGDLLDAYLATSAELLACGAQVDQIRTLQPHAPAKP